MLKTMSIRLARSVCVLFVVIVAVNHLTMLLPGDATSLLLSQDATAEQRAELARTLGLDKNECSVWPIGLAASSKVIGVFRF